MNYTAAFWLLNALGALLRLLVIGRIGLSGDEAHYWTYTQHPALSYFDHPPLVAWLIRMSTAVFGQNEFAVRLPTVLIFFVVSWVVYRLARELFDEKTAFWSVVLLNVTPVFSFLGAVMTIPDAPLSLFWILFVYLFYRTMKDGTAHTWYALGVLLGLGMLSKYNAVLLVPSAALFLVVSPKHRFWFFRKEPYIALALAAVVFLPVAVWNLHNNFVSFGFQLRHGFGKQAPHFAPDILGRALGAQAGYISPLLFVMYGVVLVLLARQYLRNKDENALFLFSFSFPTLFLFNGIACFNEILPHWPAMGYLVLSIAVAAVTVKAWRGLPFKSFTVAAWLLGAVLTILVPLQAMYKVLSPEWFLPKDEAAKIEDGVTKAEKVDVTNELYGWPEVGKKVGWIVASSPDPKPFVVTHRHYIASQLGFYIPGHPRVWCLSERVDAYDLWQRDLSLLDGRDAIFVTNDYFYVDPRQMLPFASWETTEPVEIYRGGKLVRKFWITRAHGFNLKALGADYTGAALGPLLTLKEGLLKLDHRVFWFFNRDLHNPVTDAVMWHETRLDTSLGVNTGLVILIILIGILLRSYRREKFWPEFILAIGIIGIGGLVVHFMKDYFCRLRPLAVFGPQVNLFAEHLERGSFPSGHTQIAFSAAAFLASRFRKYWWVFYPMALVMGLSRVYVGMHWPSDVLGGAVVGVLVAWAMIKLVRIE